MSALDLTTAGSGGAQGWAVLDAATAALDPPFAVLDLDALAANAADLARRAGRLPIRVASKSIRSREVLAAVLARPGFRGILAYTLPEALWLADGAEGFADVVVGYPTADRAAIRRRIGHRRPTVSRVRGRIVAEGVRQRGSGQGDHRGQDGEIPRSPAVQSHGGLGPSCALRPARTTGGPCGQATGPERENPPWPAGSRGADDGTRTHDLLHGKQTL